MHAHLHCGFRNAATLCCFGDGQPLQLHEDDRQPMPVRELLEEAPDVTACIGRLDVGLNEEAAIVFEGLVQGLASGMSAKEIHELVARDGMDPCGQGLVVTIGVSRIVHGEQGLLEDVFDVG